MALNKYLIKKFGDLIMAKPIGSTPILEGDAATDFLNNLDKPLTKKEKKLQKIRREQRFVSF